MGRILKVLKTGLMLFFILQGNTLTHYCNDLQMANIGCRLQMKVPHEQLENHKKTQTNQSKNKNKKPTSLPSDCQIWAKM